MTTARDFITLALKEAGVLGVGQTAMPEDINDGLTLLNRMLEQWGKRRWIIPNLVDVSAIANGNISNQIGPGQFYNSPRPSSILAAYFKQVNANTTVNNQVSFPLRPIWSYEDYANKVALKNLATWPSYFFYDGAYPNGNVFIWPIPDNTYEVHLVIKGPIGFATEIQSIAIVANDTVFVDGAYADVPLLNLGATAGSGGTVDITVVAGYVNSIALNNPGNGYQIGDKVGLDLAAVEFFNNGFTAQITQVTGTLDSEFNMPPEYEEAIHYNLCVRLTSMYQYPPNRVQMQLAQSALRSIKQNNLQVSTLDIQGFRNSGSNFYIFNADAR